MNTHSKSYSEVCNRGLSRIKEFLVKKLNNRFCRNAGWIGICEMSNRVTRLITAVVLARYLSPLEFGVAAIALTSNDLIKVLAQNGVGAKIIQAKESELEAICQAAYRLNWLFCGGLFVIQCIAALVIAHVYQRPDLAYMISALALVYLMMPFALVEAFLIQRANRLNVTAAISASQTMTDNIITAVFAVFGLGIWAVVLPKILVGPIWVFGTLSQQKWQKNSNVRPAKAVNVLSFGVHILGSEVAKAFRLHLDNIIVAYFLGLEAAGIYFFAKNAGLGISLSLITAFNTSLYAHICEFREDLATLKKEFFKSLKVVASILLPIILIQGSAAHWYVPVVFGEQWTHASLILMLLCFSALPRPFGDAASELMKASGSTATDLKWNMLFSGIFLVSIIVALPFGLVGVAIAVLLSHCFYPVYCMWVVNRVFKTSSYNNLVSAQS